MLSFNASIGLAAPLLGVSQPISTSHPDQKDLKLMDSLLETLHNFNNYETQEETNLRFKALGNLNRMANEWVQAVTNARVPNGQDINAGGKLLAFGSYRLGVHSPQADIDTVLLAPRQVNRKDFFSSFINFLRKDPEVKELHSVEKAFVPLIKLKYLGIDVDILFAQLALKEIPNEIDLLDDSLLKNVDHETIRSLNGIRVVERLLNLVPNQNAFCTTLRAIKLWATNHGVYSNSMGYLGGISWAILVARACQLYPNASPSRLVQKVFFIFSTWNWSAPVILDNFADRPDMPNLNQLVWNSRKNNTDRYHLMPIITPAFPEQNTTHNVSRSSLKVIQEEMKDALIICDNIHRGTATWKDLFEKINFFTRYKHFISISMAARTIQDDINFGGFFESRIRQFIQLLERNPAVHLTHTNVKKFKTSEKAQLGFDKENTIVNAWFIGLEFGKHAKNLDLTAETAKFKMMVKTQAREVREIGQNCSVQIDISYVKRSNLISVLPATDLKQGKVFQKAAVKASDRKRPMPRVVTPGAPSVKKSRMEDVDEASVNKILNDLKEKSTKV